MKRFVATLLVSGFSFLSGAKAQTVVDSKTYRQFFVTVTADRSTLSLGTTQNTVPNDGQTGISDRQLSFLRTAGLSDGDDIIADGILLDFRTNYDALVTSYNNDPATLAGTNNSTPAFLIALDTLVQTTMAEINASTSVAGMINLNLYLQGVQDRAPITLSKSITVYPKKETQLVNTAYHPELKSAGVVVNGCTVTPNYSDSMHVSAANSNQLPGFGGAGTNLTYFNIRELVFGPTGGFGSYGLDTSTSKATAYAQFGIRYNNTSQPVGQITVTMSGADSKEVWHVYYADVSGPYLQLGPWIDTGIVFTPDKSGDNAIPLPIPGTHDALQFVLENTPGSGPVWTQVRFYDGPYANTSGLTEGTSTVSGNCGGLLVTGFSQSSLNGFLCYGYGPWQSITSWVSVVDNGSMFLTETAPQTITWYGTVTLQNFGLIYGSSTDRLDLEFAQTMFYRTGPTSADGHTTPVACNCDITGFPPDYNTTSAKTSFNANVGLGGNFSFPLTYFLGSGFMGRYTIAGKSTGWIAIFPYFQPGWGPNSISPLGWTSLGWKCTHWDGGRKGSSNCGGGPCF